MRSSKGSALTRATSSHQSQCTYCPSPTPNYHPYLAHQSIPTYSPFHQTVSSSSPTCGKSLPIQQLKPSIKCNHQQRRKQLSPPVRTCPYRTGTTAELLHNLLPSTSTETNFSIWLLIAFDDGQRYQELRLPRLKKPADMRYPSILRVTHQSTTNTNRCSAAILHPGDSGDLQSWPS